MVRMRGPAGSQRSRGRQGLRDRRQMVATLASLGVAGAFFLAEVRAPAEKDVGRGATAGSQDQPVRVAGTSKIESRREAVELALGFLRGRGMLGADDVDGTTAFQQDGTWFVAVHEWSEEHPGGSNVLLEIERSGQSIRVVPTL